MDPVLSRASPQSSKMAPRFASAGQPYHCTPAAIFQRGTGVRDRKSRWLGNRARKRRAGGWLDEMPEIHAEMPCSVHTRGAMPCNITLEDGKIEYFTQLSILQQPT